MIVIKESLSDSIGYKYNVYACQEVTIHAGGLDFDESYVLDGANFEYNGNDLVNDLNKSRDNIKSDLNVNYLDIGSDAEYKLYSDDCIDFYIIVDKELDTKTIIDVFRKYVPHVIYDDYVDIDIDYDTGGYYDSGWGNWLPSSASSSADIELEITFEDIEADDDPEIVDLSNGRN